MIRRIFLAIVLCLSIGATAFGANPRYGALADVAVVTHAGAPTDGTSGTGAGVAGPGSLLLDVTNFNLYINANTKASPTWSVLALNALSATELGYLDTVIAGTVTGSKAVVVDANKDVSSFRDIILRNLDAGASGTAGTVDIFPTTASKGKLILSCTDQTGSTNVTLNANAMGQATQINIADPGAAAAYVGLSTAALTLAEMDVLDAVTPGTVAASKAVVVDANKDATTFRNLGAERMELSKGHIVDTYCEHIEDFLNDASGTLPGLWAKDVQANTTADYLTDSPCGVYDIIHSSASEAQAGQLASGNNLWIDLSGGPVIEFRVKCDVTGTNTLGSADQRLVIGICSDHTNSEDALDDAAVNTWFRLEGVDAKIYVECDDGGVSVDTDDQDSGVTIVDNAWMVFQIDFSSLADVKMYVDGVEQSGAAIDMSNVAANTVVQPIVCIQRDAGAEEEKVYVDYIHVVQTRL